MKTLSLFLLVATAVLTVRCGGSGSNPTKVEETTATLTEKPWQSARVSVDGVDQTDLFKDFSVTFFESTYTTQNGGAIWPAKGSWKLLDDEATQIRMEGIPDAKLLSVSATELVISIPWDKTTYSSGRKNSVQGQYVFTFSR